MVSKIRSTSTGARPIDGSSRSSSFGLPIMARATASICCSPPDIVPGLLADALRQPREELEDAVAVRGDLGLVLAQERAEVEVLVDRHPREDPPALGRVADPGGDDLVAVGLA